MNLGNQPVEILIEDIYLLVVPSPQSNVDPEEEQRRAQAAKAERLENAELLHMRGQAETSATGKHRIYVSVLSLNEIITDNSQQSQGLWASLIAKIINNLQVTVKNIHVRYEDNMSVPGVRHLFISDSQWAKPLVASFCSWYHSSRVYSHFCQ